MKILTCFGTDGCFKQHDSISESSHRSFLKYFCVALISHLSQWVWELETWFKPQVAFVADRSNVVLPLSLIKCLFLFLRIFCVFISIYIQAVSMSWFFAVRLAACCVCCVSCMYSLLSFIIFSIISHLYKYPVFGVNRFAEKRIGQLLPCHIIFTLNLEVKQGTTVNRSLIFRLSWVDGRIDWISEI